ncbi:PspA/IM30 family protein [Argonema galeatum]|uniref:PspA/IM30 family protein n=1 Tax=Argonema galeatum TaxID=2942762 RepID=UPI002012A7E4|nr:hypothetical protein [Argonema galeatum]MCL1465385.1 hypothetical protein [Argonema galeatum A003/A1]
MDASELRSALAGNIYALTIAERDYKKAQAEADKWESLYQRTLKVGNDESALKKIQFYKEVLTKKASNLKTILDEQKQRVAKLKSKFKTHLNTLNTPMNNSGRPLTEEKANQLPPISQSVSELSGNHLETRIRKIASDLEDMKSQLLQQQTAISQMLKLNVASLEEVRDILKQNFSIKSGLVDTEIKTEPASIQLDDYIDLDDELMKLKEQLLENFPKQVTSNTEETNPQASSYSSGSAVDKDLEELRKQIDRL